MITKIMQGCCWAVLFFCVMCFGGDEKVVSAEEPQSVYVGEIVEKYYQGVPIGSFKRWQVPETNISFVLPVEWMGVKNILPEISIQFLPLSTYEDGRLVGDNVYTNPSIAVMKPRSLENGKTIKNLAEQGRKDAVKYYNAKENEISPVQVMQVGGRELVYITYPYKVGALGLWVTVENREIYLPLDKGGYVIMTISTAATGLFSKPSFSHRYDYQTLWEQYVMPSFVWN